MRKRLRLVLVLTVLFSAPLTSTADEGNGFDQVCRIYTEAESTNMTKAQISTYIFDNIERRVTSKDALMAHDAVFNAAPEKRYEIFKESAEYSLKQSWDCSAVKKLLQ